MFFSLLLLLILLLIIINYYYYYYYYLNCPAPSTSLSNETCGYSGGSMQFAIAADKHGLGVSVSLFRFSQSYSRQMFIKSVLEIFYVRGVAVQTVSSAQRDTLR